MKKLILGAALFLAGITVKSQVVEQVVPISNGGPGLEGLIVEEITPSPEAIAAGVPADARTYRFFVDLTDGDEYRLMGFSGNDLNQIPFEVSSTEPFWNIFEMGAGGLSGENQNPFMYAGAPQLMHDSYGTDGRVGTAMVGVPYSMDTDGDAYNGLTAINARSTPSASVAFYAPHPIFDHNVVSSGMSDVNGGMFITLAQGPTQDNIVLVMQLTTAGDFSVSGRITYNDLSQNMTTVDGISWQNFVAPDDPPQVALTNPAAAVNVNVGEVVQLSADASDDNNVVSVEFFGNGLSLGTDTDGSDGWSIDWTAVGQVVTITAVATDDAVPAQTATSAGIDITVIDPNPTNISLTAPLAGSYDLNDIVISATATDGDEVIPQVDFYVDGNLVATDNDESDGWSVVYSPSVASNVDITAVALGVASDPVTVSFANAIPVISSLTPDAFDLTVENDTTFVAVVDDADGSINSVSFQVSGQESTSFTANAAPFEFTYTPSTPGDYTVTAVATDDNGAQSAPVSVSFTGRFDAGSGYTIYSEPDYCTSPDIFCLPVVTTAPVSDVIGYDVELVYDNNLVTPTRIVYPSEDVIADRDMVSYNYNIIGDTMIRISVFINGSAPAGTTFSGEGQVFCVEFARNASWGSVNTAEFYMPVLSESYAGFVNDIYGVAGSYSTIRETDFVGNIAFWADGEALSTDLATDITPAGLNAPVVNPDANGNFVWNILDGVSVNMVRDVDAGTSVMPIINGYDAYLTSKVTVEDASFYPNVYQIIAMDVNRDGRVAAGDITQISQRAVDQVSEFATDWLFIASSTILNDFSFRISSTYPANDGIGFSRLAVPTIQDEIALPVVDPTGCPIIDKESYKAVLLGDADGSYSGYAATTDPVRAMKSTSNAKDEIVFDLDGATFEGKIIEIPVLVSSTEALNSIDFHINFNGAIMEYVSVIDYAGIQETVNSKDSDLKLSSYSTNAINTSRKVVAVRFEVYEGINRSDISFEAALLNGKSVDGNVIGSVQAPSAVQDAKAIETVIYPNPASSILHVNFDGKADVAIINVKGQVIQVNKDVNGSTTFDVSELPSGNYTILVGIKAHSIIVVD